MAVRYEYTRYRHRSRDVRYNVDIEVQLYVPYKVQKKALQLSIRETKTNSWTKYLETPHTNPWGRFYLLVRFAFTCSWARKLQRAMIRRVARSYCTVSPYNFLTEAKHLHGGGGKRRPHTSGALTYAAERIESIIIVCIFRHLLENIKK